MAGRVEGKVAFITGAARGQGRSHAIRLAEEGADIIAVDICEQIESNLYPLATPEDLEETAKAVENAGRRIVARQADVRERASLKAVLEEGVSEFGHLEIVVANAGIMPMGMENPMDFVDATDVDLIGVMNAAAAAIPYLPMGHPSSSPAPPPRSCPGPCRRRAWAPAGWGIRGPSRPL